MKVLVVALWCIIAMRNNFVNASLKETPLELEESQGHSLTDIVARELFLEFPNWIWLIWELSEFRHRSSTQNFEPNLSSRVILPGVAFWKICLISFNFQKWDVHFFFDTNPKKVSTPNVPRSLLINGGSGLWGGAAPVIIHRWIVQILIRIPICMYHTWAGPPDRLATGALAITYEYRYMYTGTNRPPKGDRSEGF